MYNTVVKNCDDDICVYHTAGCGVPETTPAPKIMYQYAQGAQKGQTATKKNSKKSGIDTRQHNHLTFEERVA